MMTISEHTDQRNHIQTIFSIWQCPSPLLFGTVGLVIAGTGFLSTPPDGQG
jgi:hypothetical protein